MSQPLTKKNFVPGSLRGPRTARTLLLRMAADDERAQRFRETYEQRKAQDPRAYTWKRLADHVGISERAVQDWAKTGGVEYDNAQKAAEFWEVDFDWLWRGDREERATPDPFAGNGNDPLQRLAKLDKRLDRIEARLNVNSEALEVLLKGLANGGVAEEPALNRALNALVELRQQDEALRRTA